MDLLGDWYRRAAAVPRRILLADDDPRALEAARRLNDDGLAEAIVIGRDLTALADAGDDEFAKANLLRSGQREEESSSQREADPVDRAIADLVGNGSLEIDEDARVGRTLSGTVPRQVDEDHVPARIGEQR